MITLKDIGDMCMCGSKLPCRPLMDARRIFVAFVCDECEPRVRRKYRPDVFTDPNYPTEEPVEPDDGSEIEAFR